MAREEQVVAKEQHTESLPGEAARLLGREERLAGAGATADRGARLVRERVKHVVLLLRQTHEIGLLLPEADAERGGKLERLAEDAVQRGEDRKSTRLNSSHSQISY